MPTVSVRGEPVGGGIHKKDDGRGLDLLGEAEIYSPAPGMWDGYSVGVIAVPWADPLQEGDRT